MSSFTDPLELEPCGNDWRTTRDLHYMVGHTDMGLRITIPAGFVTDLATIPRIFWAWLNPSNPQYAAAAVLHDYLCCTPDFNQRIADAMFLEALQVLGVNRFTRLCMYYAVRAYMTVRGDATQRAR